MVNEANNDGKDMRSSPNQSADMPPSSTGQSAPSANENDVQNNGSQQQMPVSQNDVSQDSRPAINTIYMKKSYNLDSVDTLVSVFSETGRWQGNKYEYCIRQLLE